MFDKLCTIADLPASHRAPLLCADLVDQEVLVELQQQLAALMLEVAVELGAEAQEQLVRRYPYAFGPK